MVDGGRREIRWVRRSVGLGVDGESAETSGDEGGVGVGAVFEDICHCELGNC